MAIKLERLRNEFSDGIVEENYYHIGNIFFFLKAKRTFVYLHFEDTVYRGRILAVEEDSILIIFPLYKERQERRGILTFEALNRYYFIEVLLLQAERGVIKIQFPPKITYLVRRLYPRVSFDDLFMRFIILYSPIFASKEEERNFENNHPHFFQEIQQDHPSLRVLYQMLTEDIKSVSHDFDLTMLGDRSIEDLDGLEQKVVSKMQNVLITDTSDIESYIEPLERDILSNYSREFDEMKAAEGRKAALKHFEDLQKRDLNEFLMSYFSSPITLFDKPIGFLTLRTNIFDKHSISLYQAVEIVRLLEIFSYAITKIRIRNSHFDPSSFRTRVVNISMSGLLMEITDGFLYEYLKKNRRIKMAIPIFGEELEVYGEIIRFYEQDDVYFMGVLFFKTRPGDMEKLESFLYENLHYQFF